MMLNLRDRAAVAKLFAYNFIALAFLAMSAEVCYAYGLADSSRQNVSAISFGTVSMLRLWIPFGGSTAPSQATLGFSFGSSWRVAPGSHDSTGYHFVPSVEAGFTFRGDPVLRLGSFEARPDGVKLGVNEDQNAGFCGRNLALCIIGGVAIVGGIIYAVSDRSGYHSCEYAAGCPN